MAAVPQNPLGTSDVDGQETREWMDALSAVIEAEGPERAHFLLEQLLEEARHHAGPALAERARRARNPGAAAPSARPRAGARARARRAASGAVHKPRVRPAAES